MVETYETHERQLHSERIGMAVVILYTFFSVKKQATKQMVLKLVTTLL